MKAPLTASVIAITLALPIGGFAETPADSAVKTNSVPASSVNSTVPAPAATSTASALPLNTLPAGSIIGSAAAGKTAVTANDPIKSAGALKRKVVPITSTSTLPTSGVNVTGIPDQGTQSYSILAQTGVLSTLQTSAAQQTNVLPSLSAITGSTGGASAPAGGAVTSGVTSSIPASAIKSQSLPVLTSSVSTLPVSSTGAAAAPSLPSLPQLGAPHDSGSGRGHHAPVVIVPPTPPTVQPIISQH